MVKQEETALGRTTDRSKKVKGKRTSSVDYLNTVADELVEASTNVKQ